jgi:D-tyrosyl-tRNA(Tyr) deacylase
MGQKYRWGVSKFGAMRAVLQRVTQAQVKVNDEVVGAIGPGLLILLGVEDGDTADDLHWLVGKVARMRIFSDADGHMNLSVCDIGGEALVVSQFTLHASTRKGNRPSFIRAARPEVAAPLYEGFRGALAQELDRPVPGGVFGAMMQVSLVNDGPVTIIIDSREA